MKDSEMQAATKPTTILQVVDRDRRRVLDGQGRMIFEIVEDGAHTGRRGPSSELQSLAGALEWQWSKVVIESTGAVVERATR